MLGGEKASHRRRANVRSSAAPALPWSLLLFTQALPGDLTQSQGLSTTRVGLCESLIAVLCALHLLFPLKSHSTSTRHSDPVLSFEAQF